MASVARRPNGTWRARYRSPEGSEHVRQFDRKADAQHWLSEVAAEVVTGQQVGLDARRMSFGQWFEQWAGRQVWAPNTVAIAQDTLKSVTFRDVPLGRLTAVHVEDWVKAQTLPTSRRPGGLAASTIRNRMSVVRMCTRAAVRARVLAYDPTEGVRVPAGRRREHTMAIPTPAELARIIDAADPRFRAFIEAGAFAGLRRGEVAGLQLGDIDHSRGVVRIRRQIQGRTLGTIDIRPPKANSERTVYVPAALTDSLRRHAATFGTLGPEQWVFHFGGHLYLGRNVTTAWDDARTRARLPHFTFHCTRHYYASGLIAAGCDVVTVQRALGHSSAAITLRVYSHVWPSAESRTRHAAERLMTDLAEARAADAATASTPREGRRPAAG